MEILRRGLGFSAPIAIFLLPLTMLCRFTSLTTPTLSITPSPSSSRENLGSSTQTTDDVHENVVQSNGDVRTMTDELWRWWKQLLTTFSIVQNPDAVSIEADMR
jgi:hypothetical protein